MIELALVFGRASVAAVYAPGEDEQLSLVESAGVPWALYGLRDSYALSDGSPAVDAYRRGQPLWLSPEELAMNPGAPGIGENSGVPDPPGIPDPPGVQRTPAGDFSLAAVALPADQGGGGCLLAVSDSPGGFDADDRQCLELLAEAVVVACSP